jgi:sporulation protein YlmC with PRC-barrel domain
MNQQRNWARRWWPFLLVLVFLCLTSTAMAAETKEAKHPSQTAGSGRNLRASTIIDQLVYNGKKDVLGEVDDLIMSRRGKIKKVILDVGGFLGIGDRLVAVPFRSLHFTEMGTIVYDVTKEQLEKHPPFDYEKEGLYGYYYRAFITPYWAREGSRPRHVPVPPYGRPYAPFPPRGRYRGEYGPYEWEYFPERLRVSVILDRTILDDNGEAVGKMDDLMISADGKAEQIILSVGGFVGIDEKLVALPFKPLKMTDIGIVYNVTPEELKNLPKFNYTEK